MMHQVRNGRHVLKFEGVVLGTASAARPDAARWSDLTVYGLNNGSYVRSKVGYSSVAHRPDCVLVNWKMTAWLDLEDRSERMSQRVPCEVCQPDLVRLDPQTMMEATRYTATVARDAAHLATLLLDGKKRDQLPRLVARVVEQVLSQDASFARYWDTLSPVKLNRTG